LGGILKSARKLIHSNREGVMRELALFAGAGGGILGGFLLGWRTVCAVEIDPYCRSVLLSRQLDGILEPFPIWDDIATFDGKPWRGHVDIVTGGFLCQDISCAGKGAGIAGERSGLWAEMARVIREVRPSFVLVENSPRLTSRGLGVVLGDLADLGFDAQWAVLSAAQVGAPHRRERIYILARRVPDSECDQIREQSKRGIGSSRQTNPRNAFAGHMGQGVGFPPSTTEPDGWPAGVPEPAICRGSDGMAHRLDQLRALGNGQVPAVVALAWETLIRE
jgi:DNA (cytosine-5)-methyltransferase 1